MEKQENRYIQEKQVGSAGRMIACVVGATLLFKGIRSIKSPTAKNWARLIAGAALLLTSATAYSAMRESNADEPGKESIL